MIRRPARAPSSSISVLVATVVPWTKNPMSDGAMPVPNSSSSASTTAREGSSGTDGTFTARRSPVPASNAIRSVNVPPVSTPTIQLVITRPIPSMS